MSVWMNHACMHMWVCIYVNTYRYVYWILYISMYVLMNIHLHTHACMHMWVYMYVHMYRHNYRHSMYMYTTIHTRARELRVYIRIQCLYMYIYIHARVSRMTWYVWVTCQTRMRHVTHMKESYRTYKEVMSHGSTNSTHIWMRHIIVSTSHVTRTNHSVSHLSRCIPITTVMNDFSHVTHATVGVSQQYRVRPL